MSLEEKLQILDEYFKDMEYNGCSLQYIDEKLFECYREVVEKIEGKPYATFGPEIAKKYPNFDRLCYARSQAKLQAYIPDENY